MDELYDKTEALLKSLLSIKTGASKDLMVPALKAPSIKAPSAVKAPTVGKIPSGLPPPSKKDPVKMAEQLKNPQPGKVKVEILKVEDNGQWSLDKGIKEDGYNSGLPGHIHLNREHKLEGGSTSYDYSHYLSPHGAEIVHPKTKQPFRGHVTVKDNVITETSHSTGKDSPFHAAMMRAHKAAFPEHTHSESSKSPEGPTADDVLSSFTPKKNRN